jgi:hypothetical protein
LFPLIRIQKGRFDRQLVALYEDAMVVGRPRKGIPLEEEHCQPEGRLGIRTLLKSPQEIPWSQVRSASAAEPTWIPHVGPNWRFQVDAGSARADFQVRREDVGNVLQVFETYLPGRFIRLRGARHHLSARKTFFVLLFGIPAALGALLGGTAGASEAGLAAGLLGALAGAVLSVAFVAFMAFIFGFDTKKWDQRLKKTEKKPMQDLSGKRPFRSRRLGWLLKLGALAFLVGWVGGFITIPLPPFVSEYNKFRLHQLLGLLTVGLPMYLGYRLSLVDPQAADETASQRPILYLRAFDDDHKTNMQPPRWWTSLMGVSPHIADVGMETGRGQVMTMLQSAWAGPVRQFFNMGVDTSEEQLAHFFSKLGPFVAIGRPGETFPSPGAQRIYVRDQEWRQAVLDRLGRCQAVVLQPAIPGGGIWWEVEQTLNRVEPFRILLCLVNFRDRPDDWERFRVRIEPSLPMPLPRMIPFLDEFSFLYFERDWTPRVQRLSYRQPICWPIFGDATDLDHTLGPFVQGMHGGDREPPRPPKRRPFQLAGVFCFMLAFQMALLGLAMGAAESQSHQADRSQEGLPGAEGPPTCTSPEVIALLESLIKDVIGPTVQGVDGHKETRYDRERKIRYGQCTVETTTDTLTVGYMVRWLDQKRRHFQVEVMDFSQNRSSTKWNSHVVTWRHQPRKEMPIQYQPHPLHISEVELSKEILELTELLARQSHDT